MNSRIKPHLFSLGEIDMKREEIKDIIYDKLIGNAHIYSQKRWRQRPKESLEASVRALRQAGQLAEVEHADPGWTVSNLACQQRTYNSLLVDVCTSLLGRVERDKDEIERLKSRLISLEMVNKEREVQHEHSI